MTAREFITRVTPTELQVRADGDGRTVSGICVPFGVPRAVQDIQGRYTEQFRYGAFSKTLQERGVGHVKLYVNHGHKRAELPVGVSTGFDQDPVGLLGDFHIASTRAGDEALELVRSGILDSFSVGFADFQTVWSQSRTHAERVECGLGEVSLTEMPAHDGARVLAVRDTSDHPDEGPGSEADPTGRQAGDLLIATDTVLVDSRTRREWALRLRGIPRR
ncbi:MAG: HK97 family phage prohead protease [Actinomycetia bacterium]|nr:HK97 family phage prohead protease [Actinomycetes bacterium]